MKIDELRAACALALGRDQQVQLVVPCTSGRHTRVRLFGRRGGPLSEEIACVTERGTVAWWDPTKVLRCLEKMEKNR